MRYFPLFLLASFLSAGCITNVYLVRHAERLDNSKDAPLSEEGMAHAAALRDTLIKENIDLIYASVYLRTRQTAQPLADALGKNLILYSPDTTRGLLPLLRQVKNKNVLVVGHSDNVPWLLQQLTGDSIYIEHSRYGDLFQVRIKRGIFWEKVGWRKREF